MEKEAILTIVKNPHKILRRHAEHVPVADITSLKIRGLISAMKETLAHTPDGVGLAAPQIGKSLAIFIVSEEAEEIDKAETKGWERRRASEPQDVEEKPYESRAWKYYTFINPVIKNTSRKKLDGPEGCLSVPGKFGMVARYEKITVEAHDENGRVFTRGASRFFARVMQHELDHLAGTLFIDKTKKFIDVARQKERKKQNGHGI